MIWFIPAYHNSTSIYSRHFYFFIQL